MLERSPCVPPLMLPNAASQVVRECQPLAELREFLGGDSVEAFVLSYTALLTSAPGISPTLLANLIGARAATDRHMTKADAREVRGCARPAFLVVWLLLLGFNVLLWGGAGWMRSWGLPSHPHLSLPPGLG